MPAISGRLDSWRLALQLQLQTSSRCVRRLTAYCRSRTGISMLVDALQPRTLLLAFTQTYLLPCWWLQAAQQALVRRALATLSTEEEEDLYFTGGQHVNQLHACLVRGCIRFKAERRFFGFKELQAGKPCSASDKRIKMNSSL